MRIHSLTHAPFEGLGALEQWAIQNQHVLTANRFYLHEKPRQIDDIDLLIIMGGPMNVDEDDKYPWLTDEKHFIDEGLKQNKPMLGICLGAQLIAKVLGAQVRRNGEREIGWYPVQCMNNSKKPTFLSRIPRDFYALHWHEDTFDVPRGAQLVASSQACINQGFVYENRVVGFQFHLEMLPSHVQTLYQACGSDTAHGKYIQSLDQMLKPQQYYQRAVNTLYAFMQDFVSHLSS